MRVLVAQRAEVAADPHPEQLDRRLVVALDGQAEDAGDPATVLELIGDGRELRPENRQREVLAANVSGAAPGCPCDLDRAFEVVDLGRRQLEPPAVRRFEARPGPGEGAVESMMIHAGPRCPGHLVHPRVDYGRSLVRIHDAWRDSVAAGLLDRVRPVRIEF